MHVVLQQKGPLYLETDASGVGLGARLSQVRKKSPTQEILCQTTPY